ncbi:diaminopimelate epimerase [Thalassiella azotivora]
MASTTVDFVKGHGTENDFVLVVDPDGVLDLGPDAVAALCDRRAGVGADGLIRVVRSAALDAGSAALAEDPDAEWFMDYRNADGSVAEMCGNGVRVFTALLEADGLVDREVLDAPEGLAVGTRGGVKRVRHAVGPGGRTDWLAVDMGGWRFSGGEQAVREGHDSLVQVDGLDGVARPALSVDLGNPHTVVALTGDDELAAADLTRAPVVRPVPDHGTNVELVVIEAAADAEGAGRLRMRVHERGVGETRSCGTGACAAALAASAWAGDEAPRAWWVEVPGGTVRVSLLDDGDVELAGPAALVARGTATVARSRSRH